MTTTRTSHKPEGDTPEAEKEAPAPAPFRVPVPDPDERTLAERIAAVQQEVDRIPKRGVNRDQGYNYVTEGDVTDAIRASCGRHGIVVLPKIRHREDVAIRSKNGVDGIRCVLELDFVIRCRRGTEVIPWQGEGWDYPGEKALPKAITMAKKTLLVAMFLLSTGDDAEASSAGDEQTAGAATSRGGRTLSPRQIGMLIAKGKDAGMSAQSVRTLIAWRCERDFPLGMDDVAAAPGGKAFVDSLIADIGAYRDNPAACDAALEKYRDRVLKRLDEKKARDEAAAASAAAESPSDAPPADTAEQQGEASASQDASAERPPVSDTDEALFRDPAKGGDHEPPAWSTPAKECSCGVGDDELDPAKHANGCDLSIPF